MGDGEPVVSRTAPGWKFWARILVSVALLAVLVYKAPNPEELIPDRHAPPHGRCCCSAAVLTTLLGVVLSAWRWQRVLHVFDTPVPLRTADRPLPRGPVRRQRAAVDDRRRRAARLPSGEHGRLVDRSRSGRSCSSASPASSRCRCSSSSASLVRPSLIDVDRAWIALLIAGDHARGARDHPVRRRPSRASRAGSPSTRTGCGSSARCTSASTGCGASRSRRSRVLGTAIVYQVSVVVSVGADLPRPSTCRCRSRPRSRTCPRSRCSRCCRSRSAASACVRARSCSSSQPWA